MMETDMVCILIVNISFWICLFMIGFARGSGRLLEFRLAFIPFIIGWVLLFLSLPNIIDSSISISIVNWAVIAVLVTVVIITSLGGGYLCGRLFREDEK